MHRKCEAFSLALFLLPANLRFAVQEINFLQRQNAENFDSVLGLQNQDFRVNWELLKKKQKEIEEHQIIPDAS